MIGIGRAQLKFDHRRFARRQAIDRQAKGRGVAKDSCPGAGRRKIDGIGYAIVVIVAVKEIRRAVVVGVLSRERRVAPLLFVTQAIAIAIQFSGVGVPLFAAQGKTGNLHRVGDGVVVTVGVVGVGAE